MAEKRSDIFGEGLLVGLIGYLTVGIVFGIANLIAGRSPFYTAAVLGAALFYGISDPAQVTVSPPYIFAYNGLHLIVFLVFGLVSAWLASIADRGAQMWYLVLVLFIFVAFHIVVGIQMLAIPVQSAISGPAIWAGGAVAAAAMAAYLMWAHPRLHTAESWEDE